MIKIGEILQCGIFDSRKQFQNVKKNNNSEATNDTALNKKLTNLLIINNKK